MQKGIIGKKLGMTQLFDANGKVVPVTIIEAGPCTVVQKKTVESDGYQAVQMGYGEVSAKKVNKAAKGHFDKADVAPKRTLREFRFDDIAAVNVGDILKADAAHTLSDCLVSIGVIVGLILVACGIEMADDIMALIVMVAILFTAFDIFKSAFATFTDETRIPAAEIRGVVESVEGVQEAHQIRTRGLQGEIYLDLHILVDPEMTVIASHKVVSEIEQKLSETFPEVQDILIYVEPNDEEHRMDKGSIGNTATNKTTTEE